MYEKYSIVLAVAAFIMNSEKKILIIKKSKNESIDANLWVVPGGKVYQDEPVWEALRREVREEVGLEVLSYEWLGEDVFVAQEKYFHAEHFKCEVADASKVSLEGKFTDMAWISGKEVESYEFPPNLKKRLELLFKTK